MEREEACAISDDNAGCGEFRNENGLKRVSASFLGVDGWRTGYLPQINNLKDIGLPQKYSNLLFTQI